MVVHGDVFMSGMVLLFENTFGVFMWFAFFYCTLYCITCFLCLRECPCNIVIGQSLTFDING